MALIQTLKKIDGSILKIYKHPKTGRIKNVLKHDYGTVVAHCDEKGNPRIIEDIRNKKRDVYIKSQDGTAVLKQGDKITCFPHILFNTICTRLFK